MEKLFILDGSSFLFRAYFAIRKMTNDQGDSTNALYGFIRSVQKLFKDFDPKNIVCVMDGPNNKASRQKIYKEYKSHRPPMPEDLKHQWDWTVEFCDAFGIPLQMPEGVEADDTIGTIAKWAEKEGIEVVICSSDKDLCQLVNRQTHLLNTHKDNLEIDEEKVFEMHGVKPSQIVDYLALIGDTSDNIPGVAGIGPKTATKLLEERKTLDQLYSHLEELPNKKLASKLAENREMAFMSQQLATLDLHVEIPKERSYYKKQKPNSDALKKLYQRARFLSLIKEMPPVEVSKEQELSLFPSEPATKQETQTKYTLIEGSDELCRLIEHLETKTELCIDTETTGIDPLQADLVGIGIGYQSGEAWYVPLNGALAIDEVKSAFNRLFKNKQIGFYGHNIKYDLHVLHRQGFFPLRVTFDTMVASYLLASHVNRHSLDALSLEHFDFVKTPIKNLILSGKKEITLDKVAIEKVCDYCCEDIDYTIRLKELFLPRLESEGLFELFYDMELPLLHVLFVMEEHGIYVDTSVLDELSKELAKKLHRISKEIYEIAGCEVNINSPKQMSELLFTKLQIPPSGRKKTHGYSTNMDALEALRGKHPIIELLIDYRGYEKLRSTYVDSLPQQINPHTHRIHCSFNQSVAATGRLSSTQPNLQNIPIRTPEGQKIRTAFIPEKKGWSFLSADYSQIELRILAHLSGDPALIEAFLSGVDIHKKTASLVFNVPIESVTEQMRYRAKAVNFGIIYGLQAFGLSKQLGVDIQEAASFINAYFASYPKVKEYLDNCKQGARENGFVTTLWGRKRILTDINSKNQMHRAAAERLATNSPIQGSQADIIKLSMIEIQKHLEASTLQSKMLLQIHDELVFECPDEELDTVKEILIDKMQNAYDLKIPLLVSFEIGKNWGEC